MSCESFFLPFHKFQHCLRTVAKHSQMAHFNLRMMNFTCFLPSQQVKHEPCSESHKLQRWSHPEVQVQSSLLRPKSVFVDTSELMH